MCLKTRVLTQKKSDYAEYRKAKKEMQNVVTAKRNVEIFYKEQETNAERKEPQISM